jgi:hypothetical protein
MYVVLSEIDEQKATEFLNKVCGIEATEFRAIFEYRNLLNNQTAGSPIPVDRKAIFLVKAWNAFITNTELKHFRFSNSEKIPGIIGIPSKKPYLQNK